MTVIQLTIIAISLGQILSLLDLNLDICMWWLSVISIRVNKI